MENEETKVVDVSIIIVNWNTQDILKKCLKSIYTQTQHINFEVILIDNASSDDSVQMVKEIFPEVILIENQENRGFAAANNQGIAIAKGRYVLLLNSDTVILNNAISKTISFADDNPEAAVVGCRVLNPDRSLQPTCFMFPSILNMVLSSSYLYKLLPRSKFFGRERMTWWDRSDVREVDVVIGCFMLVRPQAIEQVGMMDEQYFMYCEETDWCYRFKQTGWKNVFTPEAEIIHLGGVSSRQKHHQMILQKQTSILLFMRKHKSCLAYIMACFLAAIWFLIRVPYWLSKALFSNQEKRRHILTAHTYMMGAVRSLCSISNLCTEKQFGNNEQS